jgi:hypothetical protein
MKEATSPIAISTTGTPIPIPIFAPLDNPLELGVVAEEFVGVEVGCVEVVDGCVAVDELDKLPVAAANTFKSELCHHTGMPFPYTL